MNPFNFPGPKFLLFYFLLTCGVMALLWLIIEFRELILNRDKPSNVSALEAEVAKDPYLIACLRGGSEELIRVALIGLLERGLLVAHGEKLKADAGATGEVRRPLDKAILKLYKKSGTGKAALTDAIVSSEVGKIRKQLSDMGLFPSMGLFLRDRTEPFRARSGYVAVGFLWLVALVKIVIALGRGRTNIGFLLMMAFLLVPIAAIMICSGGSHTDLSKKVRDRLYRRFAGLGNRSSSLQFDGQTGDVTFCAAVFGLASLSPEVASIIKPLELTPPPPPPSSGGGSYSSGGSSCGSSHGSSCGSSCGGGGGCGGCG